MHIIESAHFRERHFDCPPVVVPPVVIATVPVATEYAINPTVDAGDMLAESDHAGPEDSSFSDWILMGKKRNRKSCLK